MKPEIKSKESIIELLHSNREKIQGYGAKKLGLFGSFARDEQDASSDIDFLVEFLPGKKSFDNFIHLAYFLEELFQRRVEVVTPEGLSPYLKPYIDQEIEYVSFAD